MGPPARRPGDVPGDADLVLRVRAGDRAALDGLYQRFHRPAFALARRLLADDALAEDVLLAAFLGVWRDPGVLDGAGGAPASCFLALVHRTAVDAVRREESQRRRVRAGEGSVRRTPTATAEVQEAASGRKEAERIRAALRALSPEQREALTLSYYGGYTQREVAALTRTPLDTVQVRLLAGMRRLHRELGGAAGAGLGTAAVDGTTR